MVGLRFSCKAVLVAFMLLFILVLNVRNVNGFFTNDMVLLDSDAKSGHFTRVGVFFVKKE